MNSESFLIMLERNGFNFYTGVPCSYLKSFCRLLEEREPNSHMPAPREDLALGLAAGAYMGGKLPVVYMQNSGLGYSLEVFSSLHLIYSLPVLVLLTYRGTEDDQWEEHVVMGEHTESLLKTFRLPYEIFDDDFSEARLVEIRRILIEEQTPYFILIGREGLS